MSISSPTKLLRAFIRPNSISPLPRLRWSRARAAERSAAVALVLLACACSQIESWSSGLFGDDDEAPPEEDTIGPEQVTSGPTIPYEVTIEGDVPDDVKSLLEQVSDTARRADRPPSSITVLRRRAEDDTDTLTRALRSRGYYASRVEAEVDRETDPARVIFEVEAGPVYTFRDITIEVTPPGSSFDPPQPAALGLEAGSPAVSQAILDAESQLLAAAKRQGFALAQTGDRRAVVNHDTRTMDVTLRIQTGPLSRFGETTISGLTSVEEVFVRRRLRWQEGEVITPNRLEETRQQLVDSGLFSEARVTLGEKADPDGEIPVRIRLAERKHRSIALGARIRTDEGFGGSVSWEHRNLFGEGEQLSVELDVSEINQNFLATFRNPDLFRTDQALVASAEVANETPDAYDSRSAGASIGFERRLGERKEAGISLAYRYVDIEQEGGQEQFGLLSLPAYLRWDASNNLLNPTRGWRVGLENEPFVDTLESGVTFNRSRINYSHYVQVVDEPGIVLAGRTSLGTLFGAQLFDIPADERFYAGGGGSVRGWGFQRAGELDAEDNPIGGRSLFEASGEIRTKITESIGGVVFLDAGAAYPETFPTFDNLFFGTGVGVRYFSPVGPFRFDVGFPIDPRASDDKFQIYISLGQAF